MEQGNVEQGRQTATTAKTKPTIKRFTKSHKEHQQQ
jgi:hypothetical protein